VGTVALAAATDVVSIASSVSAAVTLATRVAKVDGSIISELAMIDDEVELYNDGGATVDASDALPSKMSVWAPSAHPHFWL
jgi:hypothetical protein